MPIQTLTNLERRTIANLSIPRNTLNLTHEVMSDPHAAAGAADLPALLEALAADGLVVNLGAHDTPGALAAAADAHAKTIMLPDEKVRLFERRLAAPHRAWRAQGDQWMMTQDGFAALHSHDGVGDPAPASTATVEQLIRDEHARVYHDELDAGVTLGDKLLPDEFAAWAAAVADQHERQTGDRPRLPVAGGSPGYSDATEVLILTAEFGKATWGITSPFYMAAVTVAVTDVDTGSTITEANYTGYARKSVAAADMGTPAAGTGSNVNAITFAACTALTSAVIGFAACVAATVGVLTKYGTCTLVNVSSTQQPLTFGVGAFTSTLD